MKSALRIYLSASYVMIGILLTGSLRSPPPYPAAPDFLHGKACHTILRSLCSLTNRVPLPPHPGDRINRSMLSCRDMAPLLSTHSPTAPRGKGGGASHQRGKAFPRPQGGCMVFPRAKPGCEGFIQTGAFYKLEAPHHHPLNPMNPLNLLNPQAPKGLIYLLYHRKKRPRAWNTPAHQLTSSPAH